MTNDFIISRARGAWRIVATSDPGKAFAAGDDRFADGRADLVPAEALSIFQELLGQGYYPSVPDGLPPPSRKVLYTRLAVLLVFVLIPLVLFELLG